MDADQAKKLRDPFPASAIGKLPKGGVMLDYVGHAAITSRLIEVDPEWSWEPMALDELGLPQHDKAGNLWIRLTIAGVTRLGVGDGKNEKERIGDALRNAAMRFGVALDLWSKEDLDSHGAEQAAQAPSTPRRESPPSRPAASGGQIKPATRGRMFALLGELNLTDDEQRDRMGVALGRTVESRASLTEDEAQRVIRALEARKEREKLAAAIVPDPEPALDDPTLDEGWQQ